MEFQTQMVVGAEMQRSSWLVIDNSSHNSNFPHHWIKVRRHSGSWRHRIRSGWHAWWNLSSRWWLSEWIRCNLACLKCRCCGIDQRLSFLLHPSLKIIFHVILVFSALTMRFADTRRVVSEKCVAVVAVVFRHCDDVEFMRKLDEFIRKFDIFRLNRF